MQLVKAFTSALHQLDDESVVVIVQITYESGAQDTLTLTSSTPWMLNSGARWLYRKAQDLIGNQEISSGHRHFISAVNWTDRETVIFTPMENNLVKIIFFGDFSGSFSIHRIIVSREGLQNFSINILRQLRNLQREVRA